MAAAHHKLNMIHRKATFSFKMLQNLILVKYQKNQHKVYKNFLKNPCLIICCSMAQMRNEIQVRKTYAFSHTCAWWVVILGAVQGVSSYLYPPHPPIRSSYVVPTENLRFYSPTPTGRLSVISTVSGKSCHLGKLNLSLISLSDPASMSSISSFSDSLVLSVPDYMSEMTDTSNPFITCTQLSLNQRENSRLPKKFQVVTTRPIPNGTTAILRATNNVVPFAVLRNNTAIFEKNCAKFDDLRFASKSGRGDKNVAIFDHIFSSGETAAKESV